MYFVSITRLKVKSIFYIFKFMHANEVCSKQLVQTPGYIYGKELINKGMVFWTLNMWGNDTAMKGFRNSVPHKNAIQKLPYLCSEASYFHWVQFENSFPDWSFASDRLLKEGKLTKVRTPSFRQINNNFPPIKWVRLERIFRLPKTR